MAKTILYIDGENLKNYIKKVLLNGGVERKNINIENFNLPELLKTPLKGIKISEKRYYSARLREYKETPRKSKQLILRQRVQKSNLEKQGFIFIMSGNVRPQTIITDGKKKIIFREKGVDVKIAVDMVVDTCDKLVDTAILCSSDSDLQPAIEEISKRGVEIIYLGFEISPNRGLSYTCNRTILMRNSEVINAYKKP